MDWTNRLNIRQADKKSLGEQKADDSQQSSSLQDLRSQHTAIRQQDLELLLQTRLCLEARSLGWPSPRGWETGLRLEAGSLDFALRPGSLSRPSPQGQESGLRLEAGSLGFVSRLGVRARLRLEARGLGFASGVRAGLCLDAGSPGQASHQSRESGPGFSLRPGVWAGLCLEARCPSWALPGVRARLRLKAGSLDFALRPGSLGQPSSRGWESGIRLKAGSPSWASP
ncbi:hypothetical protein chiPu_0021629 [Chiloscyllium punctatum]|uniref:Uncharacterized protein n=1 Tax=Chiloscyllium punctatum TaxID=137246 RepID=A0A401RIX7_CHIPU|nr:hypothetical protein [Chiloscyllium punctatum]